MSVSLKAQMIFFIKIEELTEKDPKTHIFVSDSKNSNRL